VVQKDRAGRWCWLVATGSGPGLSAASGPRICPVAARGAVIWADRNGPHAAPVRALRAGLRHGCDIPGSGTSARVAEAFRRGSGRIDCGVRARHRDGGYWLNRPETRPARSAAPVLKNVPLVDGTFALGDTVARCPITALQGRPPPHGTLRDCGCNRRLAHDRSGACRVVLPREA